MTAQALLSFYQELLVVYLGLGAFTALGFHFWIEHTLGSELAQQALAAWNHLGKLRHLLLTARAGALAVVVLGWPAALGGIVAWRLVYRVVQRGLDDETATLEPPSPETLERLGSTPAAARALVTQLLAARFRVECTRGITAVYQREGARVILRDYGERTLVTVIALGGSPTLLGYEEAAAFVTTGELPGMTPLGPIDPPYEPYEPAAPKEGVMTPGGLLLLPRALGPVSAFLTVEAEARNMWLLMTEAERVEIEQVRAALGYELTLRWREHARATAE